MHRICWIAFVALALSLALLSVRAQQPSTATMQDTASTTVIATTAEEPPVPTYLAETSSINQVNYSPPPLSDDQISTPGASTADHRLFPELQGPFATGPDVTRACLRCHTEAAHQVHRTSHWTWTSHLQHTRESAVGEVSGKSVIINNFCVAIPSNEPRCTSCHAGYGWRDKNFDWTSQDNVDCLVCHDQTRSYRKFPTAAGHPAYEDTMFGSVLFKAVDLPYVAQRVGKPSRHTCGSCHFFGGGGEGVKHGDMDPTLLNASASLDVHMSPERGDFNCVQCHTTEAHYVHGRNCPKPPFGEREQVLPGEQLCRTTCESCHSNDPHEEAKLNDHVKVMACQTCHIPTYARERPTKMWWDWGKAGRKAPDGSLIVKKDDEGNVIYHSKKGEFVWEKDVVPEYYWYNGKSENMVLGEKVDPAETPIKVNRIFGEPGDKNSRIYPFKVHRGRQPWDPVHQTMVVPKLFGKKGTGAYWAEYDWDKAVRAGMDYVGLPFSGKAEFIETEMYWPINHMIAPAQDALQCADCHAREGRMAGIPGIYMPGRDHFPLLDRIGQLILLGVLIGVLGHGLLRVAASGKRNAS